MADSLLLKLLLAMIVLLIVCIPEWFDSEGTTVDLSCIDPCTKDLSDLSTVTSMSLICHLQDYSSRDVLEWVMRHNNTISSITLSIYMNQSTLLVCDPRRNTHPLFQEVKKTQGNSTNVLLKIQEKHFVYSEVESHVTLVNSDEDIYPTAPFSLEIRIRNYTKLNSTMHHGNVQEMGLYHDFITVSLQFESNTLCFSGTLGIIWLLLIPLVFVCGLVFVACKVMKDKNTVPMTL
ncbi:uncharacterized protein LOC134927742 isoform X2 [Pseudophryne corroboree]